MLVIRGAAAGVTASLRRPRVSATALRSPLSSSIMFPLPKTSTTTILNPLDHSQKRMASFANLHPRRQRFRKTSKGFFKLRPLSLRGTTLQLGNYGLKLAEGGRLKDKQLDAMRTVVRRAIKPEKGAKFFLRCFTDRPVTKKAAETRMGKGKGSVEYYAAWVAKDRIVLELKCQRRELALDALRIAAATLPLRTDVVELGDKTHAAAPRVLPFFIRVRQRRELLEKKLADRRADEVLRGVRAATEAPALAIASTSAPVQAVA